jgi:hypothetical protein
MSNLKIGESQIQAVRLINKVSGDPSKGQNFQIELAHNRADANITANFLRNDTRISQPKNQLAWRAIEPEVFFEYFPVDERTKQALLNLQPSGGLPKDQLQEGVHFLRLAIKNPTVDGQQLVVQINESVVRPHPMALPKINPSKPDQPLMFNGQPIYRTTSIEFKSMAKDVRLTADVVDTPVASQPARAMAPNVGAAMVS